MNVGTNFPGLGPPDGFMKPDAARKSSALPTDKSSVSARWLGAESHRLTPGPYPDLPF